MAEDNGGAGAAKYFRLPENAAHPTVSSLPPPYTAVYGRTVKTVRPAMRCGCANSMSIESKVRIVLYIYQAIVAVIGLASIYVMIDGLFSSDKEDIITGVVGMSIATAVGCSFKLSWSPLAKKRNIGLTILFCFLVVLAVLDTISLGAACYAIWQFSQRRVVDRSKMHYDEWEKKYMPSGEVLVAWERSHFKKGAVIVIIVAIVECTVLAGLAASIKVLLDMRTAIKNGLDSADKGMYKRECKCGKVGGSIQDVIDTVRIYYAFGGAVAVVGMALLIGSSAKILSLDSKTACAVGAVLITIGAFLIFGVHKIECEIRKRRSFGLTILVSISGVLTAISAFIASYSMIMTVTEIVGSMFYGFEYDLWADYHTLPSAFITAAGSGLFAAVVGGDVKVLLRYRRMLKTGNSISLLDRSRVYHIV